MTKSKKRRVKITKQIAVATLATKALAITITNDNGIHTHTRNGEIFNGNQAECPLCASGSEFERSMGRIGA